MDGIVTSFRSAFAVAVVVALVCATPVTADGVPTASSRGPQFQKRASPVVAALSRAGRGGKAVAAPSFVATASAVAATTMISKDGESWANLEIPSSQSASPLEKRASPLTSALPHAGRGIKVAATFVGTANAVAGAERNSRGRESWTNLQIPSSQPANHGLRKRTVYGAANAVFTAGSTAAVRGAVGGALRGALSGVKDAAKIRFDQFGRLIGVSRPPPPPPSLLQKLFDKSSLRPIVDAARTGATSGAIGGFLKGATAKGASGGAPAASGAGKAALVGTGAAVATAGTVVVADTLIDNEAEPVRQR